MVEKHYCFYLFRKLKIRYIVSILFQHAFYNSITSIQKFSRINSWSNCERTRSKFLPLNTGSGNGGRVDLVPKSSRTETIITFFQFIFIAFHLYIVIFVSFGMFFKKQLFIFQHGVLDIATYVK